MLTTYLHPLLQSSLKLSQVCVAMAFMGLGLAMPAPALAVEGPPMANGVISSPALVANQDIAKAQAAGVITTYMTQGATTCDDQGQNCRSLFGADDRMDYSTTQANSQALTGVQSFSFQGSEGDANAISSQTASFVVACGDSSVRTLAGIAIKAVGCLVNTSGDAQLTVQVCTAPSRSNPVTQPDNAVPCSADPAAANFRAPFGKVCLRPACDSEPVNSLNGWSAPQTISWQTSVAQTGSEDAKSKNGLALVFYPALGAGIPANFKADSDNMTAVKIVQTFINSATNQTAVGVKVAYRHKATVTKDMMIQGASSVPNPGEHTAQWDTILKLQGNALIPQYQEKFAKNGTECLQQIQGGIAGDGKISVCDQNYSNESGIRPMALTAQVAAEGQDCGTTTQCLQEVVNTNTWSQTCNADVPLSMRECTTYTEFSEPVLTYTRSKKEEICTENRFSATYGCETKSNATASLGCAPGQACVRELTCTLGQQYNINMGDNTGMGHDGFKGGDYLIVDWACTSDDYPTIRMHTNSQYRGTLNATVPNGGSVIVENGDGWSAVRFINNTTCTNGQCTGTYTMILGIQSPIYGPLAEGCQAYSSDGFAYYYNPMTGESCSPPPIIRYEFHEASFGASSRIVASGAFSMARLYGLTYDLVNGCSSYEAAH